ncbi:ATP-dependent RNA helicase HrpA [Trebonia kvetii]|uniref:RNA helicase n=1 Tax=Trebonia kvetii TaxID=2480626 RepID=A0A6P2BWQ3_9ACTN|nr:ATP-dependent RNA helicase HrpA [Trebonia kvetii]TVZ02701.1 ATP-dependent RNA helicase HrpA [Trebonia kvetii]
MNSPSARIKQRAASREAALAGVAIGYPQELPVSQRRDDIAAAIRDHQVVIVAGETGSGKTTQIPKICLELGRGVTGQIGHTQPRRIAARTVAERIAEELGTKLGDVAGYKVRFTDRSGDATAVKLMTDGILLAEIGTDRNLTRYDTLIIDEAHERSLNIDFILGYLRQLLPRRPDLKVIITSATIDPERFAEHFKDARTGQPAPIIEVSGRTYPVEVRYRPIGDPDRDEDRDQVTAITDAIGELERDGPGDILVFLSGEQEIRDTADALKGRAGLEILPLYSRLSSAEQHRVFEVPAGRSMSSRRVVLATNVAETSLTVPGIRYVIDPGTARISRYSLRTKVQRLPIEAISQASANQRKGRCGRVADGICIRLYSQEDFESRPEFTDPEIQRTNLASVILQMAAARLGDVRKFPFVDPPDPRAITDGVKLLEELNAVASDKLTETGRQMARLPVDPRIARMIIESDKQGCAREILVIAAALSIQDPRERPSDNQQAADTAHRRFTQPESDFLAYVALWDYLAEQQRELSGSAFRRLCRAEFLNYLRVREWQDLHGQLSALSRELGLNTKTSSTERVRVHTALLSGLLSHVGMKVLLTPARPPGARPGAAAPAERGRRPLTEYLGARGTKFAVFPGSGLARKPPDWLVAAELVETSRLWARTVAAIEPEWVEPVAAHLVKRSYSEPRWSRNSGSAVATEKVTLYGIPIIADRTVLLHRIDPVLARELFIRHALVEGDWQTRHHFFRDNTALIEQAAALEQRARRRGLVAGEEALYAFYDARVPADAVSARHFDTWWKKQRHETPDLLTLTLDDLLSAAADELDAGDYPEVWTTSSSAGLGGGGVGGLSLSYEFQPGSDADGVTIDIPLKTLNQARPEEFSWQVPGLRLELVTELIRSLPKNLRRELVPAPNVAREILAKLDGAVPDGDIRDVMSRELLRLRGAQIPPDAFDLDRLPTHLRLNFRILDGTKVVAAGKDLAALQRQLRPKVRATLSARATAITRTGVTAWNFGPLPKVFTDGEVKAYPALVDAGAAVDVRLFESPAAAARAMRAGTRRLVLLAVKSPANEVAKRLTTAQKLVLSDNPHGSVAALFADCVGCAVDGLIAEAGGPAWDAEAFARITEHVRPRLHAATYEVVTGAEEILRGAHDARMRLDALRSPALAPAVADIRAQLGGLIAPGFLTAAGSARLPALARYVKAVGKRLDKLNDNAGRDAQQMAVVHRIQDEYTAALALLPPEARVADAAREIRWQIEELRVSLFAQTMGTPVPVSERRILTAIANLG